MTVVGTYRDLARKIETLRVAIVHAFAGCHLEPLASRPIGEDIGPIPLI